MRFKKGQKVRVVGKLPEEYTLYNPGDITTYEGEDGEYMGKHTSSVGGGWIYTENIQPIDENSERKGVEKKMALRIGEKYIPKEGASCGNFDSNCTNAKYIVITQTEDEDGYTGYTIHNSNGDKLGDCSSCYDEDDLELFSSAGKNMENIKTLSKAQKEAWGKDQQALYRVGIVDANGELIGVSDATTKALFRVNRSALVAQAEADIKEAEADIKEAEAEEAKEKAKSK